MLYWLLILVRNKLHIIENLNIFDEFVALLKIEINGHFGSEK